MLTQGPSTIIEEMLADCERILESQRDVPRPISPNPRYREVAYAIGMVMQHKRYHYTCVIFGWDKVCCRLLGSLLITIRKEKVGRMRRIGKDRKVKSSGDEGRTGTCKKERRER